MASIPVSCAEAWVLALETTWVRRLEETESVSSPRRRLARNVAGGGQAWRALLQRKMYRPMTQTTVTNAFRGSGLDGIEAIDAKGHVLGTACPTELGAVHRGCRAHSKPEADEASPCAGKLEEIAPGLEGRL